MIAVRNAVGGKYPDFGHTRDGGKRESMARAAWSIFPKGCHLTPDKCDNSRTGYGLRPGSQRVGGSTPRVTKSAGAKFSRRRGDGSELTAGQRGVVS